MIERQTSVKIKMLRTDLGGEFVSNAFKEYCQNEGIQLEAASTDCPWQNGKAERYNRTAMEMTLALLVGQCLLVVCLGHIS